jgi:hypothetical protein
MELQSIKLTGRIASACVSNGESIWRHERLLQGLPHDERTGLGPINQGPAGNPP